jgi:TfoX/Sxy family transcriptional regulator of competence genes
MILNKLVYLEHFILDRLTTEGTMAALITNNALYHKLVTTTFLTINTKAQWNHSKNNTKCNLTHI